MQNPRHGKRERRHSGVEVPAVLGNHLVAAAHGSNGSFQMRSACILEALARLQERLLPNHTGTLDFDHLVVGVGDDPVAA